ncbi:prolyl oligopeptidase family serine peptidase [Sediminicoccus sp. KRV36]|uniref:alpha/beta hydrolase family protein n=1 Tax=Sediminicoccus sp. KRV36 TaxID=3133721 RepID=UPI0020107E69|nr:prolyl oligopeptidase family serine peptidase [Sediminicoccus rosea]UPY36088.1 prolyl oligopeptidase family serine peptidase [Sediminicoccus rosea]
MRRARLLAASLLAALLLGACASEAGLNAQETGETLHLPAAHVPGGLFTRICRPASAGPARLVVLNHGSPGDPAVRPAMRPATCASEAVRWFTARGYVVAIPMRRGYGQTSGPWAEGFGGCSRADYGQAGRETARDIRAAVLAMQGRPGVAARPAVVVGQSAGGWGSLALAAENPPEVGAIVNMAGGRGGWQGNLPNNVCRPDELVRAAAGFGAAARLPTLWIYAANDSFFDPALARGMADAWQAAGAPAVLRPLPAFGQDGHGLFFGRGGSAIWGPIVEAFLRN